MKRNKKIVARKGEENQNNADQKRIIQKKGRRKIRRGREVKKGMQINVRKKLIEMGSKKRLKK